MTKTPCQAVHNTSNEAETIALAERFAAQLRPGDIVTIEGDLGAGKTRFVKGIAGGLGHDPSEVSSPTFAIAAEHHSPEGRCPLIHVDAYRLSPTDALEQLGIEETAHAILVIEWASRLEDADDHLDITHRVVIEHTAPDSRRITISNLRPPNSAEALSSQS
ncbi:MAG: tRNA (adenosine(37)-N6)-threonylcarbamoyltransferase complex ATPase subunit type 1 TsaE [Planctomycetota bacterium]